MQLLSRTLLALLVAAALWPLSADAWNRGQVQTFATLPDGAVNPEGITVDDDGNVYVGLFAFRGTPTGRGQILVFSPQGAPLRTLDVQNSSPALLDMAFSPKTGDFLVIDFGAAQVLKVNPFSGTSSVFTTIPGGPGVAGPNVLTFDKAGNVYISDSFQGVIWKTGKNGGPATAWVSSPLLATSGVPPFGANGLAFNKKQTALFVANTGNDTVVRIPVTDGVPGTPAVFVNSVNGADGLIIDDDDNLWVAANQADEIVVIDPDGRAIAKLGDFGGIDAQGRPIGFLFPASLVRHKNTIYVTNLALDLRLFSPTFSTGVSQWAAEATRHTVSKIPAVIPSVPGLP